MGSKFAREVIVPPFRRGLQHSGEGGVGGPEVSQPIIAASTGASSLAASPPRLSSAEDSSTP
jgi:hypothetical protein